jgi:hypothetical protein
MTSHGWLGKSGPPLKELPAFPMRSLSPVNRRPAEPNRIVLGVLGTRSSINAADFTDQILSPILEAWGTPDEILGPADGESSYVIQAWANKHEIPVTLVACDWVKQGRRAAPLRDARIQRDATHFLLLQGPRSNALGALASRLDRKGRPVVISPRPGQPVQTPAAYAESLQHH